MADQKECPNYDDVLGSLVLDDDDIGAENETDEDETDEDETDEDETDADEDTLAL